MVSKKISKLVVVVQLLICCISPQVSGQQQARETCDALDASIEGSDTDVLGSCTRDAECLRIFCTEAGVSTSLVTFFPCEAPVFVNLFSTVIDININTTGGFVINLGQGSTVNVVLEPIPGGLRFGVFQTVAGGTITVFKTVDVPLQCDTNVPKGCGSAGMLTCCESSSCRVPVDKGVCYCDELCYSNGDCCPDILTTCPRDVDGSSDPMQGSGSGSGSGISLESSPPKIISFPSQNITVTAGARLFISIKYDSGNPQGFLVWRFNRTVISSRINPRVTVLSGGGLTVRAVIPGDAGEYNVTVTNDAGSDSRLFNVIVAQSPVTVEFEEMSSTFSEGSGRVEVCAVADFPARTASRIVVRISQSSGSAQAIVDFRLLTGLLVLTPITPRVCADILILDDSIAEGTESFNLDLSPLLGNVKLTRPTTQILIQDNDIIKLVFEEPLYKISESVAGASSHLALRVCAARSAESDGIVVTSPTIVNVTIFTVNGTARSGVDFVPVASRRSLSLRREGEEMCECVQLLPDNMVEGDEIFKVVVNSSDPRVIGSSSRVLIKDDDGAVFIRNTPLVKGRAIIVKFFVKNAQQFSKLVCSVRRPGQVHATTRICNGGVAVFLHLLPIETDYQIRIEGVIKGGSRVLLAQRPVRLDSRNCSVHLVNSGVTVSGTNATIEWQGTGPVVFKSFKGLLVFTCQLNSNSMHPCSSPLRLTGLSPGSHQLIITPKGERAGCKRHIPKVVNFTVY